MQLGYRCCSPAEVSALCQVLNYIAVGKIVKKRNKRKVQRCSSPMEPL